MTEDPIYPLLERMFDLECVPAGWDGKSEIKIETDYGTECFSNQKYLELEQRSVRSAIRQLMRLNRYRISESNGV